MIVFVKLFLAHLLGDFVLQPNSWVVDKEQKKLHSIYLYIHTLLHGLLAWAVIGNAAFVWYALLLGLLHGLIDYAKLYFQNEKTKRTWFIADQILHLIIIVFIALLWVGKQETGSRFENIWVLSILCDSLGLLTKYVWIYITAILFLTKPTSIIIRNIISVWTPEKKTTNGSSLQNAGNYIGIIERLFVFYFFMSGHFEAIGFILAAKSIFRFGDLREAKDRKLTEYVLIGTLLSFGFAFLTGILVQASFLFT